MHLNFLPLCAAVTLSIVYVSPSGSGSRVMIFAISLRLSFPSFPISVASIHKYLMSFESSVLDSALAVNVAVSPTATVTSSGCSVNVIVTLSVLSPPPIISPISTANALIGTSETSIRATISRLIIRFFIMFLLSFDFSTVPPMWLYTQ